MINHRFRGLLVATSGLLVVWLVAGCVSPHNKAPSAMPPAPHLLVLDPDNLPPITVVLAHGDALCALERSERTQLLRATPAPDAFAERFTRLLLASCEADFTPGVLAEELRYMLGVASAARWPAAYQHLLAVLQRQSHALKRVTEAHQVRYQELRLKLDALSDIEESLRQP